MITSMNRSKFFMKSYKKIFYAILAATLIAISVAFSTSATSDENTIYFNGTLYSTDNLSDSTIEWIKRYNELPKSEQLAVNSIPYDLVAIMEPIDAIDTVFEAGDDDTSLSSFRAASSLLPTSSGESV